MFADEKFPSIVATPDPRPLIPVDIGSCPVNVILGVVPPLDAMFPDPVTAVTVPPPLEAVAHVPSPLQNVEDEAEVPLLSLATGRFPVVPADIGRPVQFVSVPLLGVPNKGETRVGEIDKTGDPDPVQVDHDGIPLEFVVNTELLAVVSPETVVPEDA